LSVPDTARYLFMKPMADKHKIIDIKPDGIHSWDGHIWEDVEMYRNATVIVSRNECGEMQVSWMRQENTEDISDEII